MLPPCQKGECALADRDFSVWQLPSTSTFLGELEALTWTGGAMVVVSEAMPPGLTKRLDLLLRDSVELSHLQGGDGRPPLIALCEQCGCETELREFARANHVSIVDLLGVEAPDIGAWKTFLSRFHKERRTAGEGAALVVLCPPDFPDTGMPVVRMDGRLRQSDAMIWAELKGPTQSSELMQVLAISVAIELCGWRLDLIEDFVTQRFEDILSPAGWLERNADLRSELAPKFRGETFACPIALFVQGDVQAIERRVWKAQVASIFPWLEQNRQRCVEYFRKHLRVDGHAANLGVREVEDLEFGALSYQLKSIVPRAQHEILIAFANMRNALAHRKLVALSDMKQVLENGSSWLSG